MKSTHTSPLFHKKNLILLLTFGLLFASMFFVYAINSRNSGYRIDNGLTSMVNGGNGGSTCKQITNNCYIGNGMFIPTSGYAEFEGPNGFLNYAQTQSCVTVAECGCTQDSECGGGQICSGYSPAFEIPYSLPSYVPNFPEYFINNGGSTALAYEGSSTDSYTLNTQAKADVINAWDPEAAISVGEVIDWGTYRQALTRTGLPNAIQSCPQDQYGCTVGQDHVCIRTTSMGSNSSTTNYIYSSHTMQTNTYGLCLNGIIKEPDARRQLDPLHDSLFVYNGFTSQSAADWCQTYSNECKDTSCEFFFTNSTSCSSNPVGSTLTCNYTTQIDSIPSDRFFYSIQMCSAGTLEIFGQCENPPILPPIATCTPTNPCAGSEQCVGYVAGGNTYTCQGGAFTPGYCDSSRDQTCDSNLSETDCNNQIQRDQMTQSDINSCTWTDLPQTDYCEQAFSTEASCNNYPNYCTWMPSATAETPGQCVAPLAACSTTTADTCTNGTPSGAWCGGTTRNWNCTASNGSTKGCSLANAPVCEAPIPDGECNESVVNGCLAGEYIELSCQGTTARWICDNGGIPSPTCSFPNAVKCGGDGCFVAGTQITMADGSKKSVESVTTGDVLLGAGGSSNEVEKLYKIYYSRNLYSLNGSDYFVSDTHPLMTTEGWKSFNPEGTLRESPDLIVSVLKVGDVLVTEQGLTRLVSVSSHKDPQYVYNFRTYGNHTYYADGFLAHNPNQKEAQP